MYNFQLNKKPTDHSIPSFPFWLVRSMRLITGHYRSHAWDVIEWFSRLLNVRVKVMCILAESLCFFYWQGNIPCAGLSLPAAHDVCLWQRILSSRFRLQPLYTARRNSAGLNLQINKKIQFVPRSRHSVSVIKTSQLMLYREIIAVCSEIRIKHINTLCGQNVEFLKLNLVVYKAYFPSNIYLLWFSARWVGLPLFRRNILSPSSSTSKMEAADTSESLVPYHTVQCHNL
jgi:hypothetical protein